MLLYRGTGKLYVGGVSRLNVSYSSELDPILPPPKCLHVRIKNSEVGLMKLGYLKGPFLLYVSARSASFSPNRALQPNQMLPVFDPALKAGSAIHFELPLSNDNEKHGDEFVIEIVSQIVFTTTASVNFDISIGRDEASTKMEHEETGVFSRAISVLSQNEKQLWSEPKTIHRNSHLVILSHGLHSNTPADLLFLKESIIAASTSGSKSSNLVVRGLSTNVCRTEKGVKYLGKSLAKYVVSVIEDDKDHFIDKISFVGHSLGGVVNVYALAWIQRHHEDFFSRIRPVNFIGLASPFLGISSENPLYVRFALDFGIVGKTGQDLSLLGAKPILRLLPNGPAKTVLNMFTRRTIYANVVNDGIVPLRTSCLLYLDWKGLGTVEKAKRENPWGWGSPRSTPDLAEQHATKEESSVDGANNPPSPVVLEDMTDVPDRVDRKPPKLTLNTTIAKPPDRNKLSDNEGKLSVSPQTLKSPGPASRSRSPFSSNTPVSVIDKEVAVSARPTPAESAHHTSPKDEIPSASQRQHLGDDKSNTLSPPDKPANSGGLMNALMTYLRPHGGKSASSSPKKSHHSKIYTRSQTVGDASDQIVTPPPKTTFWESAGDLLNPPLPTSEFLSNPATRPRSIFHDRIYNPEDIPDLAKTSDSGSSTFDDHTKKAKQRAEEKIAIEYHQDTSWRKVLVRLEPDAHNNIIVRRMFANAYGWDVIAHLVQNHFTPGMDEVPSDSNEMDSNEREQTSDSAAWEDETAFNVSEDDKDST